MNTYDDTAAHAALDRLLARLCAAETPALGDPEVRDDDVDIVRDALFALAVLYRTRGDLLKKTNVCAIGCSAPEDDDLHHPAFVAAGEPDPVCNCGSEDVTWTTDPYAMDVHDETVWRWICDGCYQQSCDDI